MIIWDVSQVNKMRSLGLDIGDKRIGVAISDPGGTIAFPLATIAGGDEDTAMNDIMKLTEQYEVECIIAGLPRSLNGGLGKQADKVTAFVEKLSLRAKESNLLQVAVRFWDERLSTKAAERLVREAGGGGNKARSRAKKRASAYRFSAKVAVDAMAAAFILQGFLDSLEEQERCEGKERCQDL